MEDSKGHQPSLINQPASLLDSIHTKLEKKMLSAISKQLALDVRNDLLTM